MTIRRYIDLIESVSPTTVLAKAKQMGFRGFGGQCGAAAVAINRVLFGGRGKIVGAFNKAFLDHDHLIGHVAVHIDGAYWDADGKPKHEDLVTSWGMLDVDDSDYQESAAKAGIEWNDETASEVDLVEFENDDEVLKYFDGSSLTNMEAILKKALAEPISEDTQAPAQALIADLRGNENVSLDLHVRGPDRVSIEQIWSEVARGQGHATAVMWQLVQKADELGVTLVLEASPLYYDLRNYDNAELDALDALNDKALSVKQLVRWYEKFGFIKEASDWDDGAVPMIRVPSSGT